MDDPTVNIIQKAEPSTFVVTTESVSATGMSFLQAQEAKSDSEVKKPLTLCQVVVCL